MDPTFQSWILPLLTATLLTGRSFAQDGTRTEHFDRDPSWEGFNNRVRPKHVKQVTQDFGYAQLTNFPGGDAMGGRITRSAQPAYYARKLGSKTLNDALSASGMFKLSASSGGSGIFFGWFNSDQPGGGGRPINSLGLDFDGEGSGARLAVRMINSHNKSCGTFITPFIPGKFRPTPIHNDGTTYLWELVYDPAANGNKGRFTFKITSDNPNHEAFEGKEFSVDLPNGFKAEGASFDHFGLMNMMKAGGTMTIHFGELTLNGGSKQSGNGPGWEGFGNRKTYAEQDPAGAHDFGYSPDTHFAGGKPGEVGGKFWRSGDFGYYADRVGPLTLEDRLEARGKVVLLVGAPDSDMHFGWFNSTNKIKPPSVAGNFLGIHVGGPTRIGHYFQPAFTTSAGTRGGAKTGPILTPNQIYDWSILYDPKANQGNGSIRISLGNESASVDLKPGQKAQGALFDRFGLFTDTIGGQMVKLYLDDLHYTVSKREMTKDQ